MKSFYLLVLMLFLANCSSGAKIEETPVKTSPPPPPEKIIGCETFKTNEECVVAKEINFTLAYYLGANGGEPQTFSMSKPEATRSLITKLKSSEDLTSLKKRMFSEKYIAESPDRATKEEIIQYIQDEKEGQSIGKSPTEIKNERMKPPAELAKRSLEDPEAFKKMREKMQKEIDSHPFTFEISCSSFEESKLELDQCVNKLKPSLKVTSEKKVIYNFPHTEFVSGPVNSQLKLPKEFSFELISSGQDSSKQLVAIIKKRTIKEDPTGRPVFGTEKAFMKMGQSLIITP